MPLAKEPYDFEYMNHPRGTPLLGRHHTDSGCNTRTEETHDIPEWSASDIRGKCTREHGHMGRHEYASGAETICSWAPRPS